MDERPDTTPEDQWDSSDDPAYDPPPVRASRYAVGEDPNVQEQSSLRVLLFVLRISFLMILVTVTLLVVFSNLDLEDDQTTWPIPMILGIFAIVTGLGVAVLYIDARTPRKRLTALFGVYAGLMAGLVGAIAFGALLDVLAAAWDLQSEDMQTYLGLLKAIIAITLCYLAISVVLTTKDDFRLVIPYVEFAKQIRGVRPMVLDTSALIDGRIETFGLTGFLDAPLIVPQFVVDELQTLADSADKMKRARGRRGLGMVSKLQANAYVDVTIDNSSPAGHSVDHMLLELAVEQKLRVVTTDYNLNKVAQIRGVTVLNINDLANAVKSQAIPGEKLTVDVVKRGEGANQGVGYMPDGTMVVIEEAAPHIGHMVTLMVTNTLQTSAGRMIFGRMLERHGSQNGEGVDRHDSSEQVVSRMAESATSQPRTPVRSEPESPGGRRNPRR